MHPHLPNVRRSAPEMPMGWAAPSKEAHPGYVAAARTILRRGFRGRRGGLAAAPPWSAIGSIDYAEALERNDATGMALALRLKTLRLIV